MFSLARQGRIGRERPAERPAAERATSQLSALSGRNVVIDCETTGLSAKSGDRMVSFAAIETYGGEPSGRSLYFIFNPGRKCHPAAQKVHGFSDHLLSFQPSFAQHAQEVREFLGSALVVGHNVQFDISFLRAEFVHCGLPTVGNPHVCTMQAFRQKFPGNRASLDATCAKLGMDVSAREIHHGAWIDACLALAIFQVVVLDRKSYNRMNMLAPMNFVEPKPAGRHRI